jgi:rubrerythrin
MSQQLGLEEALDIAMDAELKAQAFYAQAAVEIQDPQGRDLLGRLAAFEQHHYQKLAELARSLQEKGQFIEYETRTVDQFMPLIGRGETAGSLLEQMQDAAGILSKAIENEKLAGERYRVLAAETVDPTANSGGRVLQPQQPGHLGLVGDVRRIAIADCPLPRRVTKEWTCRPTYSYIMSG